MKRYILAIVCFMMLIGSAFAVGPTVAGDLELVVGDPPVQSIRQLYATGAAAIDQTLQVPPQGTHSIELISVRIHLSAAGTAEDFTITQDSYLGAEYDAVLFTQDMTSVTDLYKTWQFKEAVFDNNDKLVFEWANGSSRTYGMEVLYRQR